MFAPLFPIPYVIGQTKKGTFHESRTFTFTLLNHWLDFCSGFWHYEYRILVYSIIQ